MNDKFEKDEVSEDIEDIRLLRASREENAGKPRLTHEQMMKELGLDV